MNKKVKELDIKLNNSKIVSDDIVKELSVSNFFDQKTKKHDELKLFSNEFKKVQA